MGAMKVWDGTTWQTVAPFSERASCFVGPDAPAGVAYAGDLWWDTDDPTIAYPGAELSYTQITSTVIVTATSAATAQLAIDSGTRTFDGSPIVIEFGCCLFEAPNGQWIVASLWDGATDLGYLAQVGPGTGNVVGAPGYGKRRLIPTVGSHNYTLRTFVTGSTGRLYAAPGGPANYFPAYIRITRV